MDGTKHSESDLKALAYKDKRVCKYCDHIIARYDKLRRNAYMRNHLEIHSEGNRYTNWMRNSYGATKKAKKDIFDEPIMFTDPIYFEKQMEKYFLPPNFKQKDQQPPKNAESLNAREKENDGKGKRKKLKRKRGISSECTRPTQEQIHMRPKCADCKCLLPDPIEGCLPSFIYDFHYMQYHPKRLKINDEKYFQKNCVEAFPFLDFRRSNFTRLMCSRCNSYFPDLEGLRMHAKSHSEHL